MGTSSRSQPRQGKEQPSPHFGSDVYFETCLLSFQVFGDVLSQPRLLEAGDSGGPFSSCFGAAGGPEVVGEQRNSLPSTIIACAGDRLVF